ncbi:two component transcriptional regulator, winged helix family [Trichormus variabilis ATCC 29413]|uniref:Two component transcriptional regulator, winged helix family n=2 Tax=Anabaena variabilis TaxID=264691 RepID=Q3MAC9_TRIV2|nr:MULTISPECIES: response regulator transcription factor [Nostocaceae]ABA22057.1 two component transcriptional regulator, winged helix family [Trichormus variabilis ATCC 29413]MBC1213681.1 response regulator transcription factor [Trichormus variabilis ARAD]MBC1254029.1 response regulator transcription factor [Trichormus variabilis V5]MBC1266914.1 response regulator transcription factor [Trichormus variabilis FSR]MBC1303274.1 response regulator transcription factor [Trichormus variabilis N2B]
MNRILIAEDEPRIAAFIEKGLRSQGFTTAVATDAYSATNMALSSGFDLMILDLGLPGKDGLDVLEELRGQGENVPVIILTARDDIQDKVAGFEAGADDYLTKPFRFEELLVRVKARLRQSGGSQVMEEMVIKSGHIVLDLRSRKVKIGQDTIELPAREFTLAETFFRHPGQVLSREQLLDRVWGYDYDPGSNIVDVYVGYLRKKLGNDLIETVRGMGYRLRT